MNRYTTKLCFMVSVLSGLVFLTNPARAFKSASNIDLNLVDRGFMSGRSLASLLYMTNKDVLYGGASGAISRNADFARIGPIFGFNHLNTNESHIYGTYFSLTTIKLIQGINFGFSFLVYKYCPLIAVSDLFLMCICQLQAENKLVAVMNK